MTDAVEVKFGGYTEGYTDDQGHYRVRWVPEYVVKGIPYDTMILGYKVNTANLMRLWKAEACESFDFDRFNVGELACGLDTVPAAGHFDTTGVNDHVLRCEGRDEVLGALHVAKSRQVGRTSGTTEGPGPRRNRDAGGAHRYRWCRGLSGCLQTCGD